MVPPIFVFLVGALLLVRSLNQCLEPGERFLFVGILAALLGADHSLSGGEVDCPHPGFHLIHILAALAAASEGIKYHLFGIKDVGSYGFTEMEVNKPVFSLMIWTVRASADPLNRAGINTEYCTRKSEEVYAAKG